MGRDSLRPKKPLGAVLRKPQGLRNGNGEANRAVRFRVFTDDVPVLRKNDTNFSELAVDAIAVVPADADAEVFAVHNLAPTPVTTTPPTAPPVTPSLHP